MFYTHPNRLVTEPAILHFIHRHAAAPDRAVETTGLQITPAWGAQILREYSVIVDTREGEAEGMRPKVTGGEWLVRIPRAEEVMNAERGGQNGGALSLEPGAGRERRSDERKT